MTVDASSLNNEQIRDNICTLIGSFNKKNLTLQPATTFAGDLDLDSLTVMDLVATIEDEFDIILPLNLLPDLENIQQVADAVEKIAKE
jgi:acyl carrier protein